MKVKIVLDGQEQELEITRQGEVIAVHLPDGRTIEAELVEQRDHSLILRLGGRLVRLIAHFEGAQRQVWVEGRTVSYRRLEERAGSAPEAAAAALSATIPAVVSQVLVSPGDAVREGDRLVLLESMKMVIPIIAPHAGTVTAIHCAAGEAVQPGVQLIDLSQPD